MNRVHILMYHRVGDFPGRVKAHGALYCHLPRFRAQMQMFRLLGYTVIGLDAAAAGLRGEAPLPARPLVLTFDDAYVDFLANAAPVLHAHGYPATVYAVSSLVGKTSEWVAPELEPAPLMNAAQLREIQSMGFTVGSHTVSHPRLAQADDARVVAETRDSRHALEDLLGAPVRHFCYPYGSHDLRAVEAAAAAGYLTGTTCERAAATPADDLLTLPRKAVARGDDVFGVAWKLLAKNTPKRPPIRRADPG